MISAKGKLGEMSGQYSTISRLRRKTVLSFSRPLQQQAYPDGLGRRVRCEAIRDVYRGFYQAVENYRCCLFVPAVQGRSPSEPHLVIPNDVNFPIHDGSTSSVKLRTAIVISGSGKQACWVSCRPRSRFRKPETLTRQGAPLSFDEHVLSSVRKVRRNDVGNLRNLEARSAAIVCGRKAASCIKGADRSRLSVLPFLVRHIMPRIDDGRVSSGVRVLAEKGNSSREKGWNVPKGRARVGKLNATARQKEPVV